MTVSARLPDATPRLRAVAPHILALLERAQRGDRDAFADLYAAFRAVTRYVCVRMRDRASTASPAPKGVARAIGAAQRPG